MNDILKKLMGEDNPLVNSLSDDMLPPQIKAALAEAKCRKMRIVSVLGGPLKDGLLEKSRVVNCDVVVITNDEDGFKTTQDCINDVREQNEKVFSQKVYIHFVLGSTFGAYIDPELKMIGAKDGPIDLITALRKLEYKMDEAKIA